MLHDSFGIHCFVKWESGKHGESKEGNRLSMLDREFHHPVVDCLCGVNISTFHSFEFTGLLPQIDFLQFSKLDGHVTPVISFHGNFFSSQLAGAPCFGFDAPILRSNASMNLIAEATWE